MKIQFPREKVKRDVAENICFYHWIFLNRKKKPKNLQKSSFILGWYKKVLLKAAEKIKHKNSSTIIVKCYFLENSITKIIHFCKLSKATISS